MRSASPPRPRSRRRVARQLGVVVVVVCVGACARAHEAADVDVPSVPRPVDCVAVTAGADLAAALRDAVPGSAICLAPGRYRGPFEIVVPVTLWGPPAAVLVSPGVGTTVRLRAPGAALLGVTVDGSGTRFDTLDAAVHVGADDTRVAGVTVRDAVFGVVVEKARRVQLVGNRVYGDASAALGLRGDAVRLWETYDSRIEGNVIRDGRDVVVWYSSENEIVGNDVRNGRYGTHFMYSHRNHVEGNRYVGNVVGIFAMYSRELDLERNLMADSAGAAGMGIGLKESSGVRIAGNALIKNNVGLYVDTSPFQPDMPNEVRGNMIRLCDTGIVFHSSPHRNTFRDNSLRDNGTSVRVDGGGDALDITWLHNDFGDYAGYDFDGDGFGDVPYELSSYSNRLSGTYPGLAFLRGTPALGLVEAVGHLFPLFRPDVLVRDPAPRLEPPNQEPFT